MSSAALARSFTVTAGVCSEKPFYVTTPIFYPNAAPHIGHLHSLVTADVLARFVRLNQPDRPVHFVTGTDEHGLKIQKAAAARGMYPQEFCDELSVHFRALCEKANISHTRFIRTSEPAHHDAVQYLWRRLDEQGLLYKDTYEGYYSVSDECFYTESQITRIPHEWLDRPLSSILSIPRGSLPPPDPRDKIVSSETGSAVELSRETNYKFRLSSFHEQITSHLSRPDAVWPPTYRAQVLDSLARGPLDDLSVSRPRERLSWGVRVPGDDSHTIYVWLDALTSYLTAVGFPWKGSDARSEGIWPSSVQIIGKDILRFHAVYFPAMLIALGLPLPKTLLTHAHWTVNRQKMSKSIGNVADPLATMDVRGVDVVRWYLARVGGRFRDDVDWSEEQLDKHANELSALLGNLLMRIASPKIAKRAAKVPAVAPQDVSLPELKPLYDSVAAIGERVGNMYEEREIAEAASQVVDMLALANQAVSQVAPWSLTTPDGDAAQCRVLILEALRVAGIALQPIMPGKSGELLEALAVPEAQRTWEFTKMGAGGIGVEGEVKGKKLFERLE